MKMLIVYYSKTGNTRRVANDIASGLNADKEEIIDRRKRTGILGYFFGGRDAIKKYQTEIDDIQHDPQEYELIVFGSPVWGWNMTPAVRTYLEKNKAKIKNYAFFVTSGNTKPERIAGYFEEILGCPATAQTGFNALELKEKQKYEAKLEEFLSALKK